MVALQGNTISSVPIEDAISRLKRVDPHGEVVETGRAMGIEFGG